MKNAPAISVQAVTKRFGEFTAVDQVDFQVQPGEIFGFLGPNGSGKTTTIRILLGLLKPTRGSVEVLGMRVEDEIQRIRPRVGYMSQRFSLYNDLSVIQNLRFYGVAYGLSDAQLEYRIHDAISIAGLERREDTKTKDLAGGWRQRLALSAAILHRPEVIFLDEPTAGVDPVSRRVFWNLLYDLVAQGITVFVTTHYMDEAEYCDRVSIMVDGVIKALDSPAGLKKQFNANSMDEVFLMLARQAKRGE